MRLENAGTRILKHLMPVNRNVDFVSRKFPGQETVIGTFLARAYLHRSHAVPTRKWQNALVQLISRCSTQCIRAARLTARLHNHLAPGWSDCVLRFETTVALAVASRIDKRFVQLQARNFRPAIWGLLINHAVKFKQSNDPHFCGTRLGFRLACIWVHLYVRWYRAWIPRTPSNRHEGRSRASRGATASHSKRL